VLDQLPLPVVVIRVADWTIAYCNPACERVAGFRAEDVVGKPVQYPDPGQDASAVRAAIRAQLAADGVSTSELLRRKRDGSPLWARSTVSRFDAGTDEELWLIITQDVTAQRGAEAALVQAQAELEARIAQRTAEALKAHGRFSTLSESGLFGTFSVTRDGVFTEANATFLEMLGYDADDLAAGRVNTSNLNLPDWADADQRARVAAVATGVAPPFEKEYRRKDGSRVAVLVGAKVEEGGFTGFALDLRERKRREAELVRSQRRFDALYSSGIVGLLISEGDGRIVEANDAFLQIIGYTRADLDAGRIAWPALTPAESMARSQEALARLAATGRAEAFEKEYVRQDGTRVPVLVAAAAIESRAMLTIVADLTERKRAEAALAHTTEQLRHAQKMEAVGRLAGGVAHDFNNLLSVILSYGQMIAADLAPNDPARADIDEIVQAALRASDLTKQLLLFSRQQVAEPRVLDLNAVMLGMNRMLQRVLGEDITLSAVTQAPLGHVRIDRSNLEQVILNLVVNARDAMPAGGSLTIETSNVELDEAYVRRHAGARPGPHVMIAVTDTGVGMDAATQARIFEPFFTTKGVGKGTGLGLSTVFGIVQHGGGTVWVYSEVGRGTTFKVYLPCVDAPLDATATPELRPLVRGTEVILLVEDEAAVRAVVRDILRRNGFRVLEAATPGEALLIGEQDPGTIDLLLTDVVMPQMNGPDLARRLCAIRPGLRAICMSGYTADSVVRQGLIDGGMAFLQKPITPEHLLRKVRQVLDG